MFFVRFCLPLDMLLLFHSVLCSRHPAFFPVRSLPRTAPLAPYPDVEKLEAMHNVTLRSFIIGVDEVNYMKFRKLKNFSLIRDSKLNLTIPYQIMFHHLENARYFN